MKNEVQKGDTLGFVAGADLSSGDPVLLGTVLGVSATDVKSGDGGEAQIVGVFQLPKASANTPGAFAAAYWNDTNKEVTTTDSGNTKIGFFVKAYGAGEVLAEVKLLPAA